MGKGIELSYPSVILLCSVSLIMANLSSNYASKLSGPFNSDKTLSDLGFSLLSELPWSLKFVDGYINILMLSVLTIVLYSKKYQVLKKVGVVSSITYFQRWFITLIILVLLYSLHKYQIREEDVK